MVERAVSIQRAIVERAASIQGEVALYILQVQNDFRTDVPQNV